jgi:hypothetical protein
MRAWSGNGTSVGGLAVDLVEDFEHTECVLGRGYEAVETGLGVIMCISHGGRDVRFFENVDLFFFGDVEPYSHLQNIANETQRELVERFESSEDPLG